MLTVYFVGSAILSVLAAFIFVCFAIGWIYNTAEGYDASDEAVYALLGLAGIAGAWTWPLTAPLGLLYLILRLVKDAFPDLTFKLKRNQTKE